MASTQARPHGVAVSWGEPAEPAEGRQGSLFPWLSASEADAVFRPNHYARFAIEPIVFITANKLGFLPGNVVKYVLRHDAKNGLEDLRKARRYLDLMIEDVERNQRGEPLRMPPV